MSLENRRPGVQSENTAAKSRQYRSSPFTGYTIPTKFLVTGASGGLGSGVLTYLLKHTDPSSDEVIASSTGAQAAPSFSSSGIAFRHADYGDPAGLRRAFEGVDKLFFVSANVFDNATRIEQHRMVIEAAKAVGVGHVGQRLLEKVLLMNRAPIMTMSKGVLYFISVFRLWLRFQDGYSANTLCD